MKENLNTLPKLHLVCGDDYIRPITHHILVTKEEICATNAHILIIYKTKDVFSEEFIKNMPKRFLIHSNQWKNFCKKHRAINFVNNCIEVEYPDYTTSYKVKYENDDFLYPVYNNVLLSESEKCYIGNIGINSDYISILTKAMFYPSEIPTVKMTFYGEHQHVIITPSIIERDVKGLIMPTMLID